jgi:Inner membrane protein YgaP-like, transmembrane domain
MNTNVNTPEQVIRPIFSLMIAAAVLLLPQLPPWLALVAIYPFFTALIGWDPFYAVFNALRRRQQTHGISRRVSHGVTG